MCGRSSLTKTEKEIEERFNASFYSEDLERYNPIPNFNVAPTHMHPVITSMRVLKLWLKKVRIRMHSNREDVLFLLMDITNGKKPLKGNYPFG